MEETGGNTMSVKVIAFDLDGTLTQHKEHMEPDCKEVMKALSENYKLIMVGAGQVYRIFNQMEHFPIDIIGNYGLQYAKYNPEKQDLDIIRDEVFQCDRDSVEARVTMAREKYGFTKYAGDNVEFHPSGCVTFPILGTKAVQSDKLAFDPDRAKRRAIYDEITEMFSEYNVFVGGSSSFDMAPKPYNKYYALDLYCREQGLNHNEVVYVGDDYGIGGNDEAVYVSDFTFICIDDYRKFPEIMKKTFVC